ncbi:MAG: hypothetical protein K0S68_733 [Candidatus Saccharibacteria bacterium]|nr:hypothetical protein [Candidatus Saccharibacteria bacterium]
MDVEDAPLVEDFEIGGGQRGVEVVRDFGLEVVWDANDVAEAAGFGGELEADPSVMVGKQAAEGGHKGGGGGEMLRCGLG